MTENTHAPAPTPKGQLPAGSMLGSYRIESVLGVGGMGTVYLATQLRLERLVALKVLRKKRLEQEGAVDKFIQEARLTARLNHPNLVSVHDAGIDEKTGLAYYTMTHVDGPNLRSYVARHGVLDLAHALSMLKGLCAGLGHAHQQNMVHRDMKPGNIILMSRDNRPLITDLGLATDRVGNHQLNSRKRFSLIGTPEYSAPDQLRNPHTATAAADIFSIGACFYFMLTGKECFDGETLIDLIINVATAQPPELESLPPRAQIVIKHFMAKDKADRPQNGDEAYTFLENIEAGIFPETEDDSDGTTSSSRRRRRHSSSSKSRRRR